MSGPTVGPMQAHMWDGPRCQGLDNRSIHGRCIHMFGLCVRYLLGGLNDPLNDGLNHIHAPEAGWRNMNFFGALGVAAT